MNSSLKEFIARYASFSETDLNHISERFRKKKVGKGSFILKQGEVCTDIVFVEKGCLRLYYLKDDIEVSVWFSFQGNSAIEIYSFISAKPSNYFIEAIEDTEVLYLTKSELQALYESNPGMQEMMRNFWEDVILNLIVRFTSLQTDSAEKRYLDLLKKPEYMESIPQKYLASFIGVTPTSLSRIRRIVARKH
ncbi:MAG TPA: Crp/Fnr family transcriptional regulator [Cyclobacteriaceae bacterium]|nr:Crp/Fnr family transcriptional regulator [Cyclobacteriaceae bacterium]